MNILCIGDVVGRPGREAIRKLLPDIKKEFSIDFVLANAENAAGGSGITGTIVEELFSLGCDVLTTGDHVWDKLEIKEFLAQTNHVIRPANFPEDAPGKGWTVVKTQKGIKVGIINLLGRVFMRYNVNCPFRELRSIVDKIKAETSLIVVDMHAEATSEKIALGYFIDGEVSAVVGTHTHVATADETVLPKGTAFITDLGMTGPHDSVIGQVKEKIVERFLKGMPTKFEVATGDIRLNGAVIDIDESTGKARSITRLSRKVN
ncbi:MAG TPA: TIGR00282 family metallophosphoesterase [Candidatus Omnitrophota bacterium]|nr:TIGR00282 family metallophosphoesterase [Candidatus Omnitrophota bacterium]HPD84562.1 TIGR00282 family metallophosphoesterase [Candidatus Omnitrophota bacterium]HRZ03420.1 TIGR00282 family metallophosphoesterase [Candidatus Omnitrophota bacterium]